MTIDHPRSPITCAECEATWEGIEGDDCYWCDKRFAMKLASEQRRLLWPEWMNWGKRFEACNEINRTVWAETRGYTRDYRGQWKRDLFKAVPERITVVEAAEALRRFEKWMTHIKKSANS